MKKEEKEKLIKKYPNIVSMLKGCEGCKRRREKLKTFYRNIKCTFRELFQ